MKNLLLVIDVQNAYTKGNKWECPNLDARVDNILKLIENSDNFALTKFVASKEPQGAWKTYNEVNRDVNEGSFLNELIPQLSSYNAYEKSVYSALGNEDIKKLAEESEAVAVTGVVAECCVLSTVMDLIDRGIYVYYIKDAVAGIDTETELAVIKVLEGMKYAHLSVLTTEEYLKLR